MTFGQVLKKLRNENHLTQSQLAAKINLSKANISKYESDSVEPNLETLNAIAELFNVSVDYLLGKSSIRDRTKKNISDAEATEILKRKFIQHGIIKEGEDISDDQLDDYFKKLSTIIDAFKD